MRSPGRNLCTVKALCFWMDISETKQAIAAAYRFLICLQFSEHESKVGNAVKKLQGTVSEENGWVRRAHE